MHDRPSQPSTDHLDLRARPKVPSCASAAQSGGYLLAEPGERWSQSVIQPPVQTIGADSV
jgi:hypothetical protein